MAEFKKRTTNNFWQSPLMLLVLFCVVVVFSYNMVGLIKKQNETAKKKALILDEIKSLDQRQTDLTKNIEELKTEQGTEKAIRDKYQVVKPGEKLVVIVDSDTAKTEQNTVKNSSSFWTWLKGLFMKK